MKATSKWINQYVPDFKGDVKEMCDLFTMSGTEVEYFEAVGDDFMIEFAVTSNRVDCLGILGLARELAAASGCSFVPPGDRAPLCEETVEEVCSVDIQVPEACPRYTALVIEGVQVGPSPDWMVERLEAIGLRSVNNIVDATNYALFLTNQPFHAFDLDKVKDGGIIVRQAAEGETQVAINDREYELGPSMTVISDATGPIAIAGVMGGGPTEVSSTTKRVLLETAYFEPLGIRATSRKLGLASDSSFRFERGIDPEGTLAAAQLCAALIVQVAGGKLRVGAVDVNHVVPREDEITFRHSEVKRIVGIDVPWEVCLDICGRLSLEVTSQDGEVAQVRPPSFRRDVSREIDVVEEVIRIHGLHNIPHGTRMPVMTVQEKRPQLIRRRIRDGFVAAGYQEVMTTSFCGEEEARGCFFAETEPVTIANAMRKDESALRQSLMPSLLAVRKTNQDLGNQDVRLVEATVVYLSHSKDELPEHLPICAVLSDGDLRSLRGDVERVLAGIGVKDVEFQPLSGRAAALLDEGHGAAVAARGEVVGFAGRPRKEVLKRADLKVDPLYLELRLDALTAMADLEPRYQPLSRFPAVVRDLALVLDQNIPWSKVRELIDGLELPHLVNVTFFDEYYGKPIPAGKKSLAFSLTYRSHERTLTGEEVDQSQIRAMAAFEKNLGAQIRS